MGQLFTNSFSWALSLLRVKITYRCFFNLRNVFPYLSSRTATVISFIIMERWLFSFSHHMQSFYYSFKTQIVIFHSKMVSTFLLCLGKVSVSICVISECVLTPWRIAFKLKILAKFRWVALTKTAMESFIENTYIRKVSMQFNNFYNDSLLA